MSDRRVVVPALVSVGAAVVSITAGLLGTWHWWGAGIALCLLPLAVLMLILGMRAR